MSTEKQPLKHISWITFNTPQNPNYIEHNVFYCIFFYHILIRYFHISPPNKFYLKSIQQNPIHIHCQSDISLLRSKRKTCLSFIFQNKLYFDVPSYPSTLPGYHILVHWYGLLYSIIYIHSWDYILVNILRPKKTYLVA